MNQSFKETQREAAGVPVATIQPTALTGSAFSLDAWLSILWRNKFLIALTTCLAILAGGYYAFVAAVPIYASSATIVLNSREEQVIDFDSVVSGLSADSSVLNTEVYVLRSRSLLGNVVDALDLVEDPEFNSTLAPPTLLDELVEGLRGLLGTTSGEEISEELRLQRIREATISGLRQAVSVRNLPSSLVFEVRVETTSPLKSARIADTIAERYIRNQIAAKYEATAQATTWLAGQVGELQTQLEAAESRVAEFRASEDLVSTEELALRERQALDLRGRIANARAAQQEAQARLARLRQAGTPAEQARLSEDAQLQQLLPRISQSGVAAAFEQRFAQIVSRLEMEVASLGRQETTLSTSLADLEQEIDRQGDVLITFQQLTREAEAIRLLYESFLRRLNETSAQEGIQQSDSRLLSAAVVPVGPAAPKKRVILVVSALLGMMVGIAIVALRSLRDTKFRNVEDLEAVTGRPVIGQVPVIPARRRAGVLDYLVRKPASLAAESVRNLRTSILMSQVERPAGTIMVCSCFPGEGKTTLSVALAQNLAAMGKKVVVIEADIRRRVLTQYLDVPARELPDYMSVLAGTRTLQQAVVHHEQGGFDILLSGEAPGRNAADVLSSEGFRALITEARRRYDHIIIDTPPVLLVPDARIVSQMSDYTMLAVAWNRTTREQVLHAKMMFESIGRPIDGFVLNNIKKNRLGRGAQNAYYYKSGAKYYVN